MNAVITINQLTCYFKDTVDVYNLSLDILEGKFFGFLSHNGIGKTITVNLLNVSIDPFPGSMCLFCLELPLDYPVLWVGTGAMTETLPWLSAWPLGYSRQ